MVSVVLAKLTQGRCIRQMGHNPHPADQGLTAGQVRMEDDMGREPHHDVGHEEGASHRRCILQRAPHHLMQPPPHPSPHCSSLPGRALSDRSLVILQFPHLPMSNHKPQSMLGPVLVL